jgi:uncharacterized damage-inducible protein DinB
MMGCMSVDFESLLEDALDSWERNNRILVNLLRAVPEAGLDVQALPGSPTVTQMFTHMHYLRLLFLSEVAPEFARPVPTREWRNGASVAQIAVALQESARAVRDAIEGLMRSGAETKIHYDNPLLFMQHLIWHEGYHHGQIKLALKASGNTFDDEAIGPLTWDVWMDKTGGQ